MTTEEVIKHLHVNNDCNAVDVDASEREAQLEQFVERARALGEPKVRTIRICHPIEYSQSI